MTGRPVFTTRFFGGGGVAAKKAQTCRSTGARSKDISLPKKSVISTH